MFSGAFSAELQIDVDILKTGSSGWGKIIG